MSKFSAVGNLARRSVLCERVVPGLVGMTQAEVRLQIVHAAPFVDTLEGTSVTVD